MESGRSRWKAIQTFAKSICALCNDFFEGRKWLNKADTTLVDGWLEEVGERSIALGTAT